MTWGFRSDFLGPKLNPLSNSPSQTYILFVYFFGVKMVIVTIVTKLIEYIYI